jgi:hypothetical protein
VSVNDQARSSAVDRRAALKKAAAAAGIVAWATPTVQALTPGIASAQGVTNCFPTGDFGIVFTGASCACINQRLGVVFGQAACCSNHTYFAAAGTVSCGAACGSGANVTNVSFPGATFQDCNDAAQGSLPPPYNASGFPDTGNCAGTTQITITANITCNDGVTRLCTYVGTFPCQATGCADVIGVGDFVNCTAG